MKRMTSALALVLFALCASQASAEEPRLGKYLILSYGAVGRPPLVLGHFVLSEGGNYKVFLPGDKPGGEGTYEYSADKKAVLWKTGPYVKDFSGDFTIDREGKTHKIRLKRTTIGTNSTDADKK